MVFFFGIAGQMHLVSVKKDNRVTLIIVPLDSEIAILRLKILQYRPTVNDIESVDDGII